MNAAPTRKYPPRIFTRSAALREFCRYPAGPCLAGLLVLLAAWRLVIGQFTWRDTIGALVALEVLWPIVEWVTHAWVLHQPLLGRALTHSHAIHHKYPEWPETGATPLHVVLIYALISVAVFLFDRPGAQTGAVVLIACVLEYEWFHLLCHTSCPLYTGWSRRRKINHLRHHNEDSNRWFGVTRLSGDWVMGTDK